MEWHLNAPCPCFASAAAEDFRRAPGSAVYPACYRPWRVYYVAAGVHGLTAVRVSRQEDSFSTAPSGRLGVWRPGAMGVRARRVTCGGAHGKIRAMVDTRFVEVGGARLAVHTAGQGTPAILIHGYPLDHRCWLDVLTSPLAAGNTLVAIDLRGHGGSPWAGDAAHAMELFADDVAAVIDTLGLGAAHVVGLSMGGYVVLALWERHPQVVRSVALVDTRSAADTGQGKAARDAAMSTVVGSGRRLLAQGMIERLVADGTDLLVKARVATMVESLAVETIVADLRGMRDRVDRTRLLSTIAVPALVVVGERDTLTPPDEAGEIARAIPGARLVVVPASGHLVPIEAPDVLVRELDRFWRRTE